MAWPWSQRIQGAVLAPHLASRLPRNFALDPISGTRAIPFPLPLPGGKARSLPPLPPLHSFPSTRDAFQLEIASRGRPRRPWHSRAAWSVNEASSRKTATDVNTWEMTSARLTTMPLVKSVVLLNLCNVLPLIVSNARWRWITTWNDRFYLSFVSGTPPPISG